MGVSRAEVINNFKAEERLSATECDCREQNYGDVRIT